MDALRPWMSHKKHKLNPGIMSPKVHHQNIEYESTSKTTISILIYFFPRSFFFLFSPGVPQVFLNVSLGFCQVDNAKALKVADEEAMHHEAMKDATP